MSAWPARAYDHGYPRPTERSSSVAGLGLATQVLLALQIAASLALLFPVLHERDLVDRIRTDPGSVTLSEAQHAGSTTNAMTTLVLASYLVAGIVWIIWFYRARNNVEAWEPQLQRLGPSWAIGSWFCPIVNFWFPYQISGDILDDTERDPADIWPDRRLRPLLLSWWLSLVALYLVFFYGRLSGNDKTLDGIEHSDTVALVGVGVRIVAAALAVAVVRQITRAQEGRRAAEALATSWPPSQR